MSELPDYLNKTRGDFFNDYQTDVVTVSNGQLFDFSISSVVRLLGEAQALAYERLAIEQQAIFPYISANILGLMGFTRSSGTKAVGTARFLLSNVFSREYIILRGTRFSLGSNVVFETDGDLVIPANTDTSDPANYQYASVTATSVNIGSNANQPAQQGQLLQGFEEVLGVFLDEATAGGTDEESVDAFFNRVSLLIGKFLENSFSLVQESEFELAIQGILGSGSVAIAVADLDSTGTQNETASMNIFAVNSDGSALNDAQKQNILSNIEPRAPLVQGRLYISELIVPNVDVNISIKVANTATAKNVADVINSEIRKTFSLQNTAELASLELYEAVYIVKQNNGLVPVVTWAYVGEIQQARDLPLPKLAPATDKTKPVMMREIRIVVEPSGIEYLYTS